MITDDCVELCQLMAKVDSAKKNQHLVEKLSERKTDLAGIREVLRTAVDRLIPLRSRKASLGKIPTADGTKAQSRLDALRATLSADPEDITRGRDFTTLLNSLRKLAEDIDSLAEEAWKPYVERVCPKLDETQLTQYKSSYSTTVEDIRRLDGEAKRLYKVPARNEESMTALEQKWERIRELVRTLPVASENPQIQKFLDEANKANGAALNLLTPAVLAWLNEQNMQGKFRIRFLN